METGPTILQPVTIGSLDGRDWLECFDRSSNRWYHYDQRSGEVLWWNDGHHQAEQNSNLRYRKASSPSRRMNAEPPGNSPPDATRPSHRTPHWYGDTSSSSGSEYDDEEDVLPWQCHDNSGSSMRSSERRRGKPFSISHHVTKLTSALRLQLKRWLRYVRCALEELPEDHPRKSPKTDSVLEEAFENAAHFGRRAVAVVKATVKFFVDVVSGSVYSKHTLVDLERGLRRRRKVPRQREVAEALEGHRASAIGRARSTSFPSEDNQFIVPEPPTYPASVHRSQSETISSGGVPTLFEETRTLLRQGMRGSQSASVNHSLAGSVASDSSREPSDVSDYDELGEYSEYPGGQASTEAPWRHPWESRVQFSPRSGSWSDRDDYDDARRHRGGAVVPLDDEPLELTHGDGSSGWSPLTEERYAVVYQPSATEARPRSREGPVGQAVASREDDRPLATASRTLPGARPQQRRGCTPLFTADDELLYSEDASLSLFKGLS